MVDYSRPVLVSAAWLIPEPPQFARLRKANRPTAAQVRGIRYERCVHRDFASRFGLHYLDSPWFYYNEAGAFHFCQPDGLLFDLANGIVTIIEIKLRHTHTAFNQLRNLYLPVLRATLGDTNWRFALCEVTRWYDYMKQSPMIRIVNDLKDCRIEEYSVYISRPRGAR